MTHIRKIDEMMEYPESNKLTDILDILINNGKYVKVTNCDDAGKDFGIKILEMSQDGHDGKMFCINRIETETQGNRLGTRLMEEICKWADNNLATLTLTPSTSFGATSTERLARFYKRFGFVQNAGRNSNFATRQSMYRNPETN